MTTLQVQRFHRAVVQAEHLAHHKVIVRRDPLPPLAEDVPPRQDVPAQGVGHRVDGVLDPAAARAVP